MKWLPGWVWVESEGLEYSPAQSQGPPTYVCHGKDRLFSLFSPPSTPTIPHNYPHHSTESMLCDHHSFLKVQSKRVKRRPHRRQESGWELAQDQSTMLPQSRHPTHWRVKSWGGQGTLSHLREKMLQGWHLASHLLCLFLVMSVSVFYYRPLSSWASPKFQRFSNPPASTVKLSRHYLLTARPNL